MTQIGCDTCRHRLFSGCEITIVHRHGIYDDCIDWEPIVTAKHEKFLRTAEAIAAIWSKDPSSKVGAVAVGQQPNQVAWGFNGFPPGIADTPERLNDREQKYKLVRHAEPNAISNAMFPVETLYVTRHPCDRCALEILAARTIREVYYVIHDDFETRWADSCAQSRAYLEEGGVKLIGVRLA